MAAFFENWRVHLNLLFMMQQSSTQISSRELEKRMQLQREFSIFNDPSLKVLQNHNPNKLTHVTRRIYENHLIAVQKINDLRDFLYNYKLSIQTRHEPFQHQDPLLLLSASIDREFPVAALEQKDERELQELKNQEIPPSCKIIIRKIALTKPESQQKEVIAQVINKLKVMVLKVKNQESTSLEYIHQTYVSRLLSALTNKQSNGERKQKINVIQSAVERHQKITIILSAIKRKYFTVDYTTLLHCKTYPAPYILHAIFYISYYAEELLFIESLQLNFKASLLYCPILDVQGRSVSISQAYLRELDEECAFWQDFKILISVHHNETSLEVPIFVSYIPSKQEQISSVFATERFNKERSKITELFKELSAIRAYVTQALLLNWLEEVFGDRVPLKINVAGKFRISISTANHEQSGRLNELAKSVANGGSPGSTRLQVSPNLYRPEIINQLLLVLMEKGNACCSRGELRRKVTAALQGSIMSLIGELSNSQVMSPLMSGSMGTYYYDGHNEMKHESRTFFSTF